MIPDINLLPPIHKKSRKAALFGWLIGLVIVFMLAYLLWLYMEVRSNVLHDEQTEQQLLSQRAQLQQQYDTLSLKNRASLEDAIAFIERVSYKVSPLIEETQTLLQEHTYLRSYTFNDTALQVTADFETISAISTYVEALENSAYFTDVQVGTISNFDITPSALQEEENRFGEVPRYSVTLTIAIDTLYIALRGSEP